ncbi:nucleotidyltransferase family protein, partial [Rhodothermus sp. AH-315-K08]|nr:nucleotidyltransferase family protein [Rhodothermus sp. AH-315-K08]
MTHTDLAAKDVVAILLCGGRGARLKPRTNDIPKPLIPLNGVPILGHVLSYYRQLGIEKNVVCTGYLADKIETYLRGAFPSTDVSFSNPGVDTSMLRRLHEVRHLMSDTVVVGYGDTLVDVDLNEMLRVHRETRALITITGAHVVSPWGLYTSEADGQVSSFREKPRQLYYVGQFVAQRSVFDGLKPALLDLPDGEGLVNLFGQVIQLGRMFHRLYE